MIRLEPEVEIAGQLKRMIYDSTTTLTQSS